MERVVKFRGKDVKSGEWVYGSLVTYPNGRCEIVVFDDSEILEYEVDAESAGQFTGLHDKNGKEIYEGDVVKQTWGDPHFVNGVLYDCFGRIGDIRYECDLIGVHTKNGLYRIVGSDISNAVIGNIHDNPNLLTNGND